MTKGVLGLEVDVDPQDWHELSGAIESVMLRRMVNDSEEFAVELARRAKAVVPFGPNIYVSSGRRSKGGRRVDKEGFAHPGRLQRSIGRETAVHSKWEHESVVFADTPYAAYQAIGISRFSGAPLRYSRASRQANYLYNMGERGGMKSPLEVMLGLGRFFGEAE